MTRLLLTPPPPSIRRPPRCRPALPAEVPVPVKAPVSEAEYWELYYEDPDHHYEWNHGYLEEKGVSDKLTLSSYQWFFELLLNYLRANPVGQIISLETGFRLMLPEKTTIRKPDLGVVLNHNPIPWEDHDQSYHGICDLCVEAVSHSSVRKLERDTVTKFAEYAQAGVKEYYLLYAHGAPQEFYRLTRRGTYVPLPRLKNDLIRSTVLPGFQFRVSDLQRQPSPEDMSEQSVYSAFMLPALQAAKVQAQREREARVQEQQARQQAEVQAQREREARVQEQQARQQAEVQTQREREARQQAESQAQLEREARFQEQQARQLAESQVQREQEARQVAETQAQLEREARQVAETQAQQEREARLALAAKLQQLEAELARHHQSK